MSDGSPELEKCDRATEGQTGGRHTQLEGRGLSRGYGFAGSGEGESCARTKVTARICVTCWHIPANTCKVLNSDATKLEELHNNGNAHLTAWKQEERNRAMTYPRPLRTGSYDFRALIAWARTHRSL